MRAIKALVIGMGVLILVGFIFIVVVLLNRMEKMDEPEPAFRSTVSLPAGTRIVEMQVAGETIILRLKGPEDSDSLVVLDAQTGIETGQIDFLYGEP
ncbi:MAG TPA: DUF6476 family protein [Alphaproteobacteria bacterium]|nr:DUF6476 family protein [Alphaproteobacteria bacterium]